MEGEALVEGCVVSPYIELFTVVTRTLFTWKMEVKSVMTKMDNMIIVKAETIILKATSLRVLQHFWEEVILFWGTFFG